MQKSKIKLINVIGGVVFICALMLNIQSSLNGETNLFQTAIAGTAYGNGLSGDCVECFNDENWVEIVCYDMPESYCEETGCTSGIC
jgi:hypothetical protein